jgi:glycosyltransferase involved in cell wall biosynthesis
MTETRRLYMVSRIPGVAGPASFQRRFVEGLKEKRVRVEFGWPEPGQAEAVMVIGGTRQLNQLRRIKKAGIPLVQRLNGMNWIHRQRWTGVSHFLRAELNNWLLRRVRRQADVIIYQSQFARHWWEREAGVAAGQATVVHNGVPLDRYNPIGPEVPPDGHIQIAVIEGRIGGGYEIGMDWAYQLARGLEARLERRLELVVAGAADASVRGKYPGEIQWLGLLPPEEIPGLHRSSHLLFAADLHPACPNSVIEAMACGTPVAAFATGAIPELVDEHSGAVVPYGADPWKVEVPDFEGLVEAAVPLIQHQSDYRAGARRRAQESFGLERMVEGYLNALGWT